MGKLYGAVRSVNITPPLGMALGGYMGRDHGAEGIMDDLFAKALVLSDGSEKAVLVTTDVAAIDYDLTKLVKDIVQKNTDIKGENVMITASHTHSGPNACRRESNYAWMNIGDTEVNSAYYTILCQNIANAIIWANNNLEEVSIGVGRGSLLGIGSNRQDPTKPFDSEVYVLRIDGKNHEPMAVVVNYACHPTVLSESNYFVSGDFPSYMMRGISKLYPSCEAMFFQGAAGNISSRYNRKGSGFDEARRMGEMLAGEVIKVMNNVTMVDEIDIKVFNLPVEIPVRDFAPDEICVKKIEDAKRNLARLQKEGATDGLLRAAIVMLQGAEINYMLKKSLKIKAFSSEMQLIKLGKTLVVSVPGELFNEIGIKVKKLSEKYDIIVAGYANDYIGYIPTAECYDEDSYESGVAMVGRDAEKIILESAEKLVSMVE